MNQNAIKNLYPTTKMLITLLAIILVMFYPGYIFQYSFFFVCLLIAILAGEVTEFCKSFFKSIFLVAIFIALFQVFLVPGETIIWEWGIFKVSQEGIMNTLGITSKLIAIGAVIILFFLVTSVKDLSYGLEEIGIPKKVTFVLMSTLNMIPQISHLSSTIMEAQSARGIETEGNLSTRMKAFMPMMGPLVLTSIQQTEERVLTLESRAFSSDYPRTSVYHIEKRTIDKVISLGAVVIFLAIFVGVIL